MLTEERLIVPGIDGDAPAQQHNLRSRDLAEALTSFTTTRWRIAHGLPNLSPDRRRTGLMAGTTRSQLKTWSAPC
jgi:hypothetical protein